MRTRLALLFASLLVCAAASAQDHRHGMSDEEFVRMLAAMSSHPARSLATVTTGVTTTVNLTARSFFFTPSTITANQGDTLVLNVSVPSNDPATEHGILMEEYITGGGGVRVPRGTTKQITITLVDSGTFAFGCNVPTCGNGHSNMIGTLIVNKLANPAPTVAAIDPSSGPTTGDTAVSMAGANFQDGAAVTFGGLPATRVTVTSSTSIVAVTPPASTPGPVAVAVTNPDGQNVAFNSFTYTLPPPAVSAVSPDSGPTSGGGTITIRGNGFVAGAKVFIGAREAGRVAVADASTITALLPLGPATEQVSQPVDVVVINPDGTRITKSGAFTYFVPPLSVGALFPPSALPAGGDVTITGAGFTTALLSAVTFGGVPATNVRVTDAATMHATAPPHALGSVDVAVTVGASSVTVPNGFTYANPVPRRRAAGR